MKGFLFLTVFIGFASVFGHPYQGEQQFESECRGLRTLIPRRSFNVPDLDSSENELPVIAIEDARQLENVSVTLDKEVVTGTFTFTNGVVEGGSTSSQDFNYDPSNKTLDIYISLKFLRFSGLYEIVDGHTNLTILGHHTFYGKGPLTASVSGLVASISITLGVDAQTEFLSIDNLKFGFNFGGTNIMAENLVVDGVPVEWETVNKNIASMREKILEALDSYIRNLIEAEIKESIKGCTFDDFIKVATSRSQENKQNFPQQH